MPRSNVTGGKQHKKKKKGGILPSNVSKEVLLAGSGQVYGYVKKKSGGTRLMLDCSDNKERSGIIRGSMFKKVWMGEGDIVLCELDTSSNGAQCYITHKYTVKDANILKNRGLIDFEVTLDSEYVSINNNHDEKSDDDYLVSGNPNKARSSIVWDSDEGSESSSDSSESDVQINDKGKEVEVIDLSAL